MKMQRRKWEKRRTDQYSPECVQKTYDFNATYLQDLVAGVKLEAVLAERFATTRDAEIGALGFKNYKVRTENREIEEASERGRERGEEKERSTYIILLHMTVFLALMEEVLAHQIEKPPLIENHDQIKSWLEKVCFPRGRRRRTRVFPYLTVFFAC